MIEIDLRNSHDLNMDTVLEIVTITRAQALIISPEQETAILKEWHDKLNTAPESLNGGLLWGCTVTVL